MSTLTTETVELDVLSQAPGPSSQPSPANLEQTAPEIPIGGHESPDIAGTETQILPSTNTQQNAPAASSAPRDVRAGFCRIAGSTLTSNLLVIPGLVVAIAGFAWMLLSQRYTVRNDRLQDCLNFRQVDIYSDVCNATIDSGLPSFWRKREELVAISLSTQDEDYWFMFAFAIVLTLSAGIFSTIWFRSKTRTFRPIISMVRIPPTITLYYHICGTYGMTTAAETTIQDNILTLIAAGEDDNSSADKWCIKLSNGYVSSDDESDHEDGDRDRGSNDKNNGSKASGHIVRRDATRGVDDEGCDAETDGETALETTSSHAEVGPQHPPMAEADSLAAKFRDSHIDIKEVRWQFISLGDELTEYLRCFENCFEEYLQDPSEQNAANSSAWKRKLIEATRKVEYSQARLDEVIRAFQEADQNCMDAGIIVPTMYIAPLCENDIARSLSQARRILGIHEQEANHQTPVERVDTMTGLANDPSGRRSVPWAGQHVPNIEQQIPAIELPEPHEPHEGTPLSEHGQHDLDHQLSATMEAADHLSPNKDISEEVVPGSPRIVEHRNSDGAPEQSVTLSDEPRTRDQPERRVAVSEIGQEQLPDHPDRLVREAQRSIPGKQRDAKRSFWSRLRRRPRIVVGAEVE